MINHISFQNKGDKAEGYVIPFVAASEQTYFIKTRPSLDRDLALNCLIDMYTFDETDEESLSQGHYFSYKRILTHATHGLVDNQIRQCAFSF